MKDSEGFLQELERAVSYGSPANREKALSYATDLLITGRYSEEQIWIFGEVIGNLAKDLELTARVRLADRLAPAAHAPANVINRLALDDAIEVAGPVLRHSERIDPRTLVSVAQSKGQRHLLAISQRRSLNEEVTDILVERGNTEVARSVATNSGARLSNSGFLNLIKRSERDSILTEHLGCRRDIPRSLFQQLIAKASDEVRQKLECERPDLTERLREVVTDVAGDMQSKFGPGSKEYYAAKKSVMMHHQYGGLKQEHIRDYAMARKLEEAIIALSLMGSLPAHVVERILTDPNGETVLILSKALCFSWDTAMALLFLGAPEHRIAAQHLDKLRADYSALSTRTAELVLKSYQTRRSGSDSGQRRLPQLHAR